MDLKVLENLPSSQIKKGGWAGLLLAIFHQEESSV